MEHQEKEALIWSSRNIQTAPPRLTFFIDYLSFYVVNLLSFVCRLTCQLYQACQKNTLKLGWWESMCQLATQCNLEVTAKEDGRLNLMSDSVGNTLSWAGHQRKNKKKKKTKNKKQNKTKKKNFKHSDNADNSAYMHDIDHIHSRKPKSEVLHIYRGARPSIECKK